ncbi:MAG: TrkH family potassium uptake protein [Oscillospiraceae bacterium]|jgi:trk system potassium uptake protein TrkH
MNYRVIGWVLAWVLELIGFLMLLPVVIALIYGEAQGWVYLGFSFLAIAVGWLISRKKPQNMQIYTKEGYVTVGLSWIMISLYGAIPFRVTGEIPHYIDAVFETASGFTTTGSSILSDVEALSHASLVWRSFTHWIGGMGVLVFILMLIPSRGGTGFNLMKAESPGYEVSKFAPRVRNNAASLYRIYIGMTLVLIAALIISGMNWFDSICIAFGAAGTGGFGVLNSSCASYTAVQQWIIAIGMMMFGVNFSFYYLIIKKQGKAALKIEEVFEYLAIILTAVIFVTINIYKSVPGYEGSLGHTIRDAFFQVCSIITTTGFTTVNYDVWPSFSKFILILLMICGACAGSTGGGLKVSRVVVSFKAMRKELRHISHPRSVEKIRMNGNSMSPLILHSLYIFILMYFIIFGASILLISADGFDFETNFSAVCATLNNIGPGFSKVGPTCNFGSYSWFSKIVLIFDMLTGRLEILPMLMLVSPNTWRRSDW